MCQPKPGPRCTNHARKALLIAKKRVLAANAGNDTAVQRIARARLAIALSDFDSTPGGQKALSEKIAVKQAEISKLDTKNWREESNLYKLKNRLEKGIRRREDQKKALKDVRSGTYASLSPYWDEEDIDKQWTCSNGDEIRVYGRESNHSFVKHAWRVREGKPIAMVHFLDDSNRFYSGKAVICDIEVNPAFRGNGLGIDTIKSVSKHYGQLYSTGSYSSSGMRSLSAHVPLHESGELHGSDQSTHYKFVDWQVGDSSE